MGENIGISFERIGGGSVSFPAADKIALAFFESDASSEGPDSYDSVVAKAVDPNRITSSDITAINRTMRARSPHLAWSDLVGLELAPWLEAVPPELDLVETSDEDWQRFEAEQKIQGIFEAVLGPHRALPVATKVLHIKRPRLFPIIDRLVAEMIGSALGEESFVRMAEHGNRIMLHIRQQARLETNFKGLSQIRGLLAERGLPRSLVRIIDGLLWSAHPASWLSHRFSTSVGL
jgi:hypothetical protein